MGGLTDSCEPFSDDPFACCGRDIGSDAPANGFDYSTLAEEAA
jgi:hypothetical protein